MELSKSSNDFFRQTEDTSITNRPMDNKEHLDKPSGRKFLGEKVDEYDKTGGGYSLRTHK